MIDSRLVVKYDGSLETDWIETSNIVLERMVTKVLDRTYYYPDIRFALDRENRKILIGAPAYDPENIYGIFAPFELRDEIPLPDDYIPYPGDDGFGFASWTIDTIAYVPNAILREAEKNIKEAYAKEDYATCYKLFDSAITFYPITGAEWRALKAQGVE